MSTKDSQIVFEIGNIETRARKAMNDRKQKFQDALNTKQGPGAKYGITGIANPLEWTEALLVAELTLNWLARFELLDPQLHQAAAEEDIPVEILAGERLGNLCSRLEYEITHGFDDGASTGAFTRAVDECKREARRKLWKNVKLILRFSE